MQGTTILILQKKTSITKTILNRSAYQIARRLITLQLCLQHHFDPATLRTWGYPPFAIWEATWMGLTHQSGVPVFLISTGKDFHGTLFYELNLFSLIGYILTLHIISRASNEEEELPDYVSKNVKSNRRSYFQENQVRHISILIQVIIKSKRISR